MFARDRDGDKRDQVNSDWETELPAVFEGASVQSTMAPSGVEETEERERGTRGRRRGELPRLYPDPRTGKRKVRQGKARQDKPSFEMGVTTGTAGCVACRAIFKNILKIRWESRQIYPVCSSAAKGRFRTKSTMPTLGHPGVAPMPHHTHTPTPPSPTGLGRLGQVPLSARGGGVSVVCKLQGH